MPRFSIIVPAYNVEKYVIRCLSSLRNQTFQNFEVVIVDDGSTDHSPQIVDTFCKENPEHFRVIHQTNKGLGGARNTGIDEARGEYLFFLDSDDYILFDTLEVINEYLEKHDDDLLLFGWREVYDGDEEFIEVKKELVEYAQLPAKTFLNNFDGPQRIFFRTELLKKHNLRWPERIWYEDSAFLPIFAYFAKRIGRISGRYYQYYRHPDSIMQSPNTERMMEILEGADIYLQKFQEDGQFEKFRDELEFRAVKTVLFASIPRIFAVNKDLEKAERSWNFVKERFPDFSKNKHIQTRIKRNPREMLMIRGDFEALWNEYYTKPVSKAENYIANAEPLPETTGDILLSVIIPVYNVEEFLLDCLDSVRKNISGINAEVIMINDGSTDQSRVIAEMFANQYPNFLLFDQTNQGLSAARNHGVEKARGKYITFLDSDDAVYENTYRDLLTLAEKDQSDMAVCSAARAYDIHGETWQMISLQKAFNNLAAGPVHIKSTPQLARDVYAWNRIIRRDFYLSHGFTFPVGMIYEDMPVVILLHYFAERVSYLPINGYMYRLRLGTANQSITQVKTDSHFYRYIEMIEYTLRLFREKQYPEELIGNFKDKILIEDIYNNISMGRFNLLNHPDECIERFRKLIQENFTNEEIARHSILVQKKIETFLNKDYQPLARICDYKNKCLNTAPCFDEDGEIYKKIPAELFGTDKEKYFTGPFPDDPETHLISASVEKDQTICTAVLYYPGISAPATDERSIAVYLEDPATQKLLPLPTELIDGSAIMENKAKVISKWDGTETVYDYSGTAFQFTLNHEELSQFLDPSVHQTKIRIEYQFPLYSGIRYLRNAPKQKEKIYADIGYNILIVEKPGRQVSIEREELPTDEMVSIIVSVYNTADTLPRMMRCVKKQDYKNIEILLIDDASTDGSGELCDQYSKQNSRYRTLHIPHSGVAGARNYGLKAFRGKYLMFADADDMFSSVYVSRLLEYMKKRKVHLVTCLAHDTKNTKLEEYEFTKRGKLYTVHADKINYWSPTSHRVVWGAIFDRYAIEGITNDEQYQVSADVLFITSVANRVQTFVHTDERLYCYMMYPGSWSRRVSSEVRYDDIRVWIRAYQMLPYGTYTKGNCLSLVIDKMKTKIRSEIKQDPVNQELIRTMCQDTRKLKSEPLDFLGKKSRVTTRIFLWFPELYVLYQKYKLRKNKKK